MAYCILGLLGNLAIIAFGGLCLFMGNYHPEQLESDAGEAFIAGIIYLVVGLVLAMVYGAGIAVNKGNAGWIYGIILISLGMTSVCCLPLTIPLLIFWIKDRPAIVAAKRGTFSRF